MSKIPNYEAMFSPESASRQPSAIRALMPLLAIPGMISLGGGLPNASTFPVESATLRLKNGTVVEVSEAEMTTALQYGPTEGLPSLVKWLKTEAQRRHAPPTGWDVCVTTGSQDALTKAFAMVLGPGDSLLCEEPTYSGALAFLQPHGSRLVGVPTDENGIIPSVLEDTLKAWNPAVPRPKALYCIPTGQNPSGATVSPSRKADVYRIASKYDLLILEDDPYYYLQFPHDESVPPSFLSMDVDGRVLRFDSFSKVLSAGMRLGWATGASPLIERLCLHSQATSLHTSGISQQVAASVLRSWGDEGWDAHVRDVRKFYQDRRDVFLRAADKHLTGLAEWSAPSAGMFVWFKLLGVEDSTPLIKEKARDAKVLLVPGASFMPDPTSPSPYVRAAFSTASEKDMDLALERLASILADVKKK